MKSMCSYVLAFSWPQWYEAYVEQPWMRNPLGVAFEHYRSVQACTPTPLRKLRWDYASSSGRLFEIDYRKPPRSRYCGRLRLFVEQDAKLHGLLLWFDAHLSDSVTISGSPGGEAPVVNSRQALPLERPLSVRGGDSLDLGVDVYWAGGQWVYRRALERIGAAGQRLEAIEQHSARDLMAAAALRSLPVSRSCAR